MLEILEEHYALAVNILQACSALIAIAAIVMTVINLRLGGEFRTTNKTEFAALLVALNGLLFSIFAIYYRNAHAFGAPSIVVSFWGSLLVIHMLSHLVGWQLRVFLTWKESKAKQR